MHMLWLQEQSLPGHTLPWNQWLQAAMHSGLSWLCLGWMLTSNVMHIELATTR